MTYEDIFTDFLNVCKCIKCHFFLVFDNNFKINPEIPYQNKNDDLTKIKSYLLDGISYFISQGYSFRIINELIIETLSDKHKLIHKIYIQNPMQIIERRMTFVIDRCPEILKILDFTDNHPIYEK